MKTATSGKLPSNPEVKVADARFAQGRLLSLARMICLQRTRYCLGSGIPQRMVPCAQNMFLPEPDEKFGGCAQEVMSGRLPFVLGPEAVRNALFAQEKPLVLE